jgi:YegS/Rv2252/BmrU family lipid kinase
VKILAIINPVSGSKKALVTYHNLALEKKGLLPTPLITKYPGHACEIIKSVSIENYEAIVVFGGDGTIHEVVNGMMQRKDGIKKPIGVIPLGTGNALMHDLDLLTVNKAIDHLLQKNKFSIDLLECRHSGEIIYSFNMVSWGIPVTINNIAEKWRFIGKQRYNLATLLELIKNPSWQCKIALDDVIIEGPITFFMTCNNQYTGNGMKIAPLAHMDDGQMDVIILKTQSRVHLLKLFLNVFSGKHIQHPDIIYRKVSKIRIENKEPMGLNIDGQQAGNTPVDIRILPKEIEIFR